MKSLKLHIRKTSFTIIILILIAYSLGAITASSYTNILPFKDVSNICESKNILNQTFVEGDLIISGNNMCIIENCEYHLTGNVIVKDNAILIIQNAVFNQTSKEAVPGVIPANVVIRDRAKLFLTNATYAIPQNHTARFLIKNEAKFYIVDSSLENLKYDVSVWVIDQSKAYIKNSVMRRAKEDLQQWTVENCVVVCDGNSEVHITKSLFDRVTTYGTSKVFIEETTLKDALRSFDNSVITITTSKVGYITAEGAPRLNIRVSTITSYISASENTTKADIWLIHMNVKQAVARGSSIIRLIDASVKDLYIEGNAMLLVGWDLPIFGPVAFPSSIAFIVGLVILNLLVVGIIIVAFVLAKKLRSKGIKEDV